MTSSLKFWKSLPRPSTSKVCYPCSFKESISAPREEPLSIFLIFNLNCPTFTLAEWQNAMHGMMRSKHADHRHALCNGDYIDFTNAGALSVDLMMQGRLLTEPCECSLRASDCQEKLRRSTASWKALALTTTSSVQCFSRMPMQSTSWLTPSFC